MSIRSLGALFAAALVLAGCAAPPQNPVALKAQALSTPGGRIAVVTTAMPKPDTSFPGAGCLLCLAAASVANSTMTDHVRTLSLDELATLKTELAEALKARGQDVVLVAEPLDVGKLPDRSNPAPDQARKDFSSLKTAHRVDRVLVVEWQFVGVERQYSAYVPTGDPYATVGGKAYVVDLGSHAYEWYTPLAAKRPASGKWDEPPKFPGLTNAYYEVIELTKDAVKRPFVK